MQSEKKNKYLKAFVVMLVVTIILSLANWAVITGFGSTRISNVTIVGDDGKEFTGLMYTPKGASKENPVPLYVCFHGYSGNARNHESWALEYARRGFAVFSIDNFGSGDAEMSEAIPPAGMTADEIKEFQRGDNDKVPNAFARYLTTINFIDKENIVLGGHSMGSSSCVVAEQTMLNEYGIKAKAFVLADPGNSISRGAATPPTNTVWMFGTADKLRTLDKDLEVAAAAFRRFGADIPESVTTVETGKTYKSADGSCIYEYYLVKDQIHEAAFINGESIGIQLDFIQKVVDTPNPIPGSNQIWLWKDIIGLVGMVSFVGLLLMTAMMLMEQIPALSYVRQELPRNVGLRGVGFAISVCAALFVPVLALYTGCFGIQKIFGALSAFTNVEYGIFRLRFTNIGLSVVIVLTVIGLVFLCLYLFTDGKKQKVDIHDLGLVGPGKKKLDGVLIGKAFLTAILTLFIGYAYLALQRSILRTDFYSLFFGIKKVPTVKFIYFVPYIVIWIICLLVSSISHNIERRLPDSGNEKKDLVKAMLFNGVLNMFAVLVMVLIENALQVKNGAGLYGLPTFGTDITRLWGMPLGLFFAASGCTYCYRKTGTIWLGGFLMGIFVALMACTFGCLHLA